MKPRLWKNRPGAAPRKLMEDADILVGAPEGPLRRTTPEKGTTPARGEEAEVVVYQPRGVGLMHTRHKPSNAHYTHADMGERKSSTPYESSMKSYGDLESYPGSHVAGTATSPRRAPRTARPPHMLAS